MDERLSEVTESFQELYRILNRLRAPDGCPWDRKQTQKSMASLILEEAYEAADAIEREDAEKVEEELGDLSMNLLMTCLIAEEEGCFRTAGVFKKISRKLVHRHPHVFGDEGPMDEDRFLDRWEEIKREERREKREDPSAAAGIPRTMPALLRAVRLLEKIKRTGADLSFLRDPRGKACRFVEQCFSSTGPGDRSGGQEMLGKLLVALVLCCIEKGLNPETALRSRLDRMEGAFRKLEDVLGDGLRTAARAEIDRCWEKGMKGPS